MSLSSSTFCEFCDLAINAEVPRAPSLDLEDPRGRRRMAKIDHDITDPGTSVLYLVPRDVDLTSSRVGDYVCSLRLGGALIDQR